MNQDPQPLYFFNLSCKLTFLIIGSYFISDFYLLCAANVNFGGVPGKTALSKTSLAPRFLTGPSKTTLKGLKL